MAYVDGRGAMKAPTERPVSKSLIFGLFFSRSHLVVSSSSWIISLMSQSASSCATWSSCIWRSQASLLASFSCCHAPVIWVRASSSVAPVLTMIAWSGS
jgi:hypothetical protein